MSFISRNAQVQVGVHGNLRGKYTRFILGLEDTSSYHEKDIEQRIIHHLQQFLLEMGEGFAFIGNQYHLVVGESDFYIDLLLYNTRLHAHVVVELKAGKFKPEYAGKLNFYLSAVDDLVRQPGNNPSMGLLLCKEKDNIIAEYALKDIERPMGLASYKLGEAIPKDFKASLPSIETIETNLKGSPMLKNELFVEFRIKKKGGRSWIITPGGSAAIFEKVSVDRTLFKTLVKAHLWQRELNRNRFASMTELAKHKGVDESYTRRLLKLNYISPKIKELIIDGKQPQHLKLQDIIYDVPFDRIEQEAKWLRQNMTLAYARRILNLYYLSPRIQEFIMDVKQPKHLNLQDIIYDVLGGAMEELANVNHPPFLVSVLLELIWIIYRQSYSLLELISPINSSYRALSFCSKEEIRLTSSVIETPRIIAS